ncbi:MULTISPECIES: hypothetical protein [Mameliella]|uniref:hypothetical protein n=1 Tax=Mameliella TaxID=1434019 RepID=UPI000B535CCE|nr:MULTISPECIES: hypothetical protein [Mameliella]MCR9273247.1 hypothetical protein [Paracoccaceae bacterium]OWV58298.1 hypothetical protein CDZ98_14845 [Mameliella alba]
MPPETRKNLCDLRCLMAQARAHRRLASTAQRLGQIDTAAQNIGDALALERDAIDRLNALEASGTLIAIEALVASATSYARERRHV